MASFPNRCQHLKINGTQCGSPALRRNRFCYFHKRHHEERIALHSDRARRRRNVVIDLPVLEDANSIQVSLMQIMRLLVAGQIDGKIAGLLLYALQTASANLQHTRFEPYLHDVILDPAAVGETLLGEHIWDDSDFQEGEEEDEEEEADKLEGEEESQDSAEEVSEVQTEPQTAAPKHPPTKPSAQLTGEEVRSQLRTQILKGFPSQVLERITRENSNRTG
jgi:hypothetical protein